MTWDENINAPQYTSVPTIGRDKNTSSTTESVEWNWEANGRQLGAVTSH